MSLNQLFKGRIIKKSLGYGKFKKLKIADIKENVHKLTNGEVVFKNYSVILPNEELEIFDSLDDIVFCKKYLFGLFWI